jgi:drug/metabolite transporter (DMT)-like permease
MSVPAPPRSSLVPFALLFIIGLAWGFMYTLIKIGVTGKITPIGYLFWFSFGCGAVLFAMCAVRRNWPRMSRVHLRYYFTTGAVRLAVANTIFYSAQKHLPIGVMAVIMTTTPMFTYALSLASRLERFVWIRFAGILMGLAGVLLIVAPNSSLPDPSLVWWVLVGFGTPLLHGIGYIMLSEQMRPPDSDSMTLGVGMFGAATIMLLPVLVAMGAFHPLWPPFSAAEIALITHFILAGFNFYALFELLRIAGPTFATQASYLAVIFGVVFGIVLFDETHSLWVWGAMALIAGGVAMVNWHQRRAVD